MTTLLHLAFFASLMASLCPSTTALEVGDQLCIQGFIMDYFCIENVNMIDNGRVTLEEPERHSVHCLVDVGICLDSAFEVLVESSSGSTPYGRGYRLDDASKSDMIDLARSVGSCTTCANGYDGSGLTRGFKAVMKVNVLDLNPDNGQNAPPLVRVNERKDSSNLGNDPCQSEYGMKEGIPSASDVLGSPTEVVIASPTVTPKTTAAPSTMPPTITTGGGNSTTPDPTDSSVAIGLLWSTIISIACAIVIL